MMRRALRRAATDAVAKDPLHGLAATELGAALGDLSDETVRQRERAGELFSVLRPGRKRGREYRLHHRGDVEHGLGHERQLCRRSIDSDDGWDPETRQLRLNSLPRYLTSEFGEQVLNIRVQTTCGLSSVRLKVEQDQLVSELGRFWRRAIGLQGA